MRLFVVYLILFLVEVYLAGTLFAALKSGKVPNRFSFSATPELRTLTRAKHRARYWFTIACCALLLALNTFVLISKPK